MSHVAQIELEVRSLDALKAACARLGTVEFVEGQKTYRWWGHSVGDYPIPKGFTASELGRCDHAIRVKGNARAYEVGVVQRDGKYHLLWDFYSGGYGLEKAIGKHAGLLRQAYGIEQAKATARQQGLRVLREVTLTNGAVRLEIA